MQNNTRFNQLWTMTWLVYASVPFIVGIDKFCFFLVDWYKYASPFVLSILPYPYLTPVLGVMEIANGILMIVNPRLGAFAIAGMYALICINLLLLGGYYDILMRDIAIGFSYLMFGLVTVVKESKENRNDNRQNAA